MNSPTAVFADTIASGASTSAGITIDAPYYTYLLQVGTMSTGMAVGLQHSADGGTTFYNVYHPSVQSATVATPQYFITATVGVGGGLIPLPFSGLKQIRIVLTGVVSGGAAFKLICSN